MRQEIQRRSLAGFHQAGHDFAQFPAVPVDDDGGEQVKCRDPVVLAVAGTIADLAAPVETDRALERVVGFALVEADLDAALEIAIGRNRVRSTRPISRSATASRFCRG